MRSSQEIILDLAGTREFYNLVPVLNRTFGRGNWTCRGRPIRKLRRIEKIRVGDRKWTAPIVFYVPDSVDGFDNFLRLHLEQQ